MVRHLDLDAPLCPNSRSRLLAKPRRDGRISTLLSLRWAVEATLLPPSPHRRPDRADLHGMLKSGLPVARPVHHHAEHGPGDLRAGLARHAWVARGDQQSTRNSGRSRSARETPAGYLNTTEGPWVRAGGGRGLRAALNGRGARLRAGGGGLVLSLMSRSQNEKAETSQPRLCTLASP